MKTLEVIMLILYAIILTVEGFLEKPNIVVCISMSTFIIVVILRNDIKELKA